MGCEGAKKRSVLVGGGLSALVALGWAGLRVTPRPLPGTGLEPAPPETVPLPVDLPPPVARFYEELYGSEVPVVDTAVVSGRGTMRISGLTLPVRFRFTHRCGKGYRHHIEVTFLGLRVLTVDESYLDGSARLELPFGVSEGDKIDQGANLALWAEAVWMPSVWVTDPAVSWHPVDDDSALLRVPFREQEQELVARFDRRTGMLSSFESLRYKAEDSEELTLWINEVDEWGRLDGRMLPLVASLTWTDEGTPWAVLCTDEVLHCVELDADLLGRGPSYRTP